MKQKKSIKLVLFDVDGVLTDGSLYINETGEAFKSFNAKDGIAVQLLKAHGIKVGILSGKDSPSLQYRCSELNFDIIEAGVKDKLPVFKEILKCLKLQASEVAFVGDDVNDILVLNLVGHSYAPNDAHPLVSSNVMHVCQAQGGRGVAREVAEDILMKSGMDLSKIYKRYLTPDNGEVFFQ